MSLAASARRARPALIAETLKLQVNRRTDRASQRRERTGESRFRQKIFVIDIFFDQILQLYVKNHGGSDGDLKKILAQLLHMKNRPRMISLYTVLRS